MAATNVSSDFMVFKGPVAVHGLAVVPGREWAPWATGKEWASVECTSKNAYGCGKVGPQLVNGLTLYFRRTGYRDLTSTMAISLSDEAAESIAAELSFPRRCLDAEGDIEIAHRKVLVVLLMFRCDCIIRRSYYLVYDSIDASLYMIPYIPGEVQATYTLAAVPDRDAVVGLKLALMARTVCTEYVDRGRLCICTPAAQAQPKSDSTVAWQTKVHRFVTRESSELCRPFSADVVFSFEGKIFWADLSQGVAYSDLGKEGRVVHTDFIKLPKEYVIEYSPKTQRDLVQMNPSWTQSITPANMSRTMGCVKDSIKFVCIDRRPGNEMVKVLTLDLNDKLWKEDEGFSCSWSDLWKQVCFMNAELSDLEPLEPVYPVLMEDGALFLLLPNVPKEKPFMRGNYYICSFDMCSKSLQCIGLVQNYHTLSPVILPFKFFGNTNRTPPKKTMASILEADAQ